VSAAVRRWPLLLIAAPAAVAVWSGWVGLGALCGFGLVHPLPGIAAGFQINTAITLPVGVEAYGAYALGTWLTPGTAPAARRFARRSALGALTLGMAGQVIYHLLAATHAAHAPWPVVVLVSCLPVLTLGFGAALTHLLRAAHPATADVPLTPEADTSAGTVFDLGADTARTPVTDAAKNPDTARTPVTDATEDPDTARTPAPDATGSRPLTTAATVARLREQYPALTTPEIAWWLGVSDRTVRRHLAAVETPPGSPSIAA
jgi:hypothetical protein